MNNELEKLDYDDVLVGLYSACIQYGARRVLQDFHNVFPKMFEELMVQGDRVVKGEQIPALLKPPQGDATNNAGSV